MLSVRVIQAMERGRAIGAMIGSIVALSAISLFVLYETPANSDDSTEQMMVYLSLVLFVMALAIVGPLAFTIAGRGTRPSTKEASPDSDADEEEEASDIELEFRALEMELDREERG